MKRYKMVFLAIFTFACLKGNAQLNTFNTDYSIAFPTGNTADFVGKTSFRGVSIGYVFALNKELGITVDAGWNVFDETIPKSSFVYGSGTLTGKQYRHSNSYPLFIGAQYYLPSKSKILPFGGIGTGTIYTGQRNDFGLYSLEWHSWQFAIRPEIGIAIKLQEDTFVKIASRYNLGFGTNNLESQNYLALNFGLALSIK